MVTFWERAVHSVNRMFMSICILVVSHFGFEGGAVVLTRSLGTSYVLLKIVTRVGSRNFIECQIFNCESHFVR